MNDIKTFNCMGKEIVKQKQLNICVSKKRGKSPKNKSFLKNHY